MFPWMAFAQSEVLRCLRLNIACDLFPVRNVNWKAQVAAVHELHDCLPEKLLTSPVLLKGTSALCILQSILFLGVPLPPSSQH